MTVHCWESGEFHGAPGHTCILRSGHAGEHRWTRNDRIVEDLRRDHAQAAP